MFYTVCGVLAGLPVSALIYAQIKGEMQLDSFLAGSIIALGLFLFCAMFFVDTSELILNDTGIQRKIFGRRCMAIPWSGIRVVREQFLKNQRYGGEIVINILPITAGDIALRIRRTIKTTDQVERFDELVQTLNQRVTQHAIPVEVCSNGVWKLRSQLSATPEY